MEVPPNGVSTLTVTATDTDGDDLTYTWSATSGTFSSTTGQSVSWQASSVLGDFDITVTASDGKKTASDNVRVSVKEFFGTLKVTSAPNNAEIIIDGQNTGFSTTHTFEQISVGNHTVTINKLGFISSPDSIIAVIIKNQTSEINFTLTQSAMVAGYTYYAGTTIPVSGVLVSIDNKTSTTGSSGFYSIEGLESGSYTLTATKDNYDTYSTEITVQAGSQTTKNLEMTSGFLTHTLSGIITNSLGQPIANATVTVLNPNGQLSNLWDTADDFGHYSIPTVPQGNRSVKFGADFYTEEIAQIFISNTDKIFNVSLNEAVIDPPEGISINTDWNNVLLSWQTISNPLLLGYNIYRSKNQSTYSNQNQFLISQNTYTDVIDTFHLGSEYHYTIKSVSIDGIEGPSSPVLDYQTQIKINFGVDAIWNGTFLITQDFQLGSNGSLQIVAGSEILLMNEIELKILGLLEALGEPTQKVIIKSLDNMPKSFHLGDMSNNWNGYVYFEYTALNLSGSMVLERQFTWATIINSTILSPSGFRFGAFSFESINIENCILDKAYFSGMLNSGSVSIKNSILINSINTIFIHTSDFTIENSIIIGRDYGIRSNVSNCIIDHSIIAYCQDYGIKIYSFNNCTISNNIVIHNGYGIAKSNTNNSGYYQDYNDVWMNSTNYGSYTSAGPNSISEDPTFVSPNYNDPINGNWNLQGGSPCIGAGENGSNIGLSDPNNIGPQ